MRLPVSGKLLVQLAKAAVSVLAVTLAGCIPGPLGKYYQPHMASGSPSRYSGTACHGQAGPPAVLHVTLASGVKARIDARWQHETSASPGRPLHVELEIPHGATVRLRQRTARVSEDGGQTWRPLPLHANVSAEVSVSNRVVMADVAPTDAAAVRSSDFRASAMLTYSLPDYVPRRFTLLIPAMRVAEGGSWPETRLEAWARRRPESYAGQYRDHHELIYTTPGSRARLAKRLSSCRAEVRAGKQGLHCDNLWRYDTGGFRRNVGPFSLSGRWYVFDVEGGKPFNGVLRVEYRQPLDWAFEQDRLQLRDQRGEVRSIPLRGLVLSLRYAIAADAKVRGVNDARHSGDTTLSLTGNLGRGEARSYRVRLPPMRIDGVTYRPPPITLEKHAFQIGLWPFNC